MKKMAIGDLSVVLSGIKITCHNSEKKILYGAKKKLIINSAEFYCDNNG